MVNIKNLVAFLCIILVILSNLAFAQYEPSYYEGRPIDPEKEGKDYYKDGDVIIYPGRMGSEEQEMMQRFRRSDFSEEEMRRMAKEKFGKDFDDMAFKKSMMEFNDRMDRKEAFSYEHEGYERYDAGPSYEGYSKEHMIFGMIFRYIGDEIDPREIKQNCNEPEKIAELIVGKFKAKVGDLQSVCKNIEEQESKCEESFKKSCSQFGTAFVKDDATEMEKLNAVAYSCPANKDAIVEACKRRNHFHLQQRLENLDGQCRKRFDFEGDRLIKECERFSQNQPCDKEKFIRQCMSGVRKEEDKSGEGEGFVSARWECYDGTVESRSDSSCRSYEHWSELSRKFCESRCNAETGKCGVNIFSVSDECKSERRICPNYPATQCEAGAVLRSKTDSNGCVYYFCEKEATICPRDVKQCHDGSFVSRIGPKCEFAPCPIAACPEPKVPSCPEGSSAEKKNDENGCVYYYCTSLTCTKPSCNGAYDTGKRDLNGCIIFACPDILPVGCGGGSHDANCVCPSGYNKEINQEAVGPLTVYRCVKECPEVSKPTCNSDERLEAYYDNTGCVTSYQCIKYQTCPAVAKPTCAEGQSLTTRYDDKSCVVGYDCLNVTSGSSITGAAVMVEYNDFLRRCENSWLEQQRTCLNTPTACDKDTFIEKCKEQERKSSEFLKTQIEKNCETATLAEIRHAEERCARIDEDRKRCLEHGAKRCEHMKGNAQKCIELMTEDSLRKFIVEETRKRCKFKDIMADEEEVKRADKAEIVLAVLNTATEEDIEKLKLFINDLEEDLRLQDTTIYKGDIDPNRFGDIKLLPFVVNAKISSAKSSERAKEVKEGIVISSKVEEAASQLASLRDSDVPTEYLFIIEDKASEVLDVSDELEDVEKKEEQKGIGYKIRLFLGLAKAAEQEEIKQLEESNSKLQNSIETLTKLIEEVPSDVAKAILKEQVENLKKQQADIQVLIETKEKKAKGWFGVFG